MMTDKQPPFLRCSEGPGFFHWPAAAFLLILLLIAGFASDTRILGLGLIAVLACLGSDAAGSFFLRQKYNWQDGQAVFHGLLLAICLPVSAPLWLPTVSGIFAIVCGKIIFGGRSLTFFHPVLLAVIFAGSCGWLGNEAAVLLDSAPVLWWAGGLILARLGAVRLAPALLFLFLDAGTAFICGKSFAAEGMNPVSLLTAFLFLSEPGFSPGAKQARVLYAVLAGICIGFAHVCTSSLARDFAVLLLLRAMVPLFDLLLSRKPILTRTFSTLSFYRAVKSHGT